MVFVGRASYFRPESHANTSEVTSDTMHPNLTLNDALSFVLQKVPTSYQQMLATNYSVSRFGRNLPARVTSRPPC